MVSVHPNFTHNACFSVLPAQQVQAKVEGRASHAGVDAIRKTFAGWVLCPVLCPGVKSES